MSEDIHKWSDGRYTLMFDEHTFFVWDNEKDERMTALNVTKKLNEQQATIEQLRQSQDVKEFSALFNQSIALKREIKDLKEENEQLLRCKYFVKAVEVFTDCPISETIADYSDGELFDEKEQLEFGKKMLEQEKELIEDE